MFCRMPFTAQLTLGFANDSRILSGSRVRPSHVAAVATIQDSGWFARAEGNDFGAGAGLNRYGQSYGGTEP